MAVCQGETVFFVCEKQNETRQTYQKIYTVYRKNREIECSNMRRKRNASK